MSYIEVKPLKEELKEIDTELKSLADAKIANNSPMTPDEIANFKSKEARRSEIENLIASADCVSKALSFGSNMQPTQVYHPTASTSHKLSQYEKNLALKAWALYNGGKSNLISRDMRNAADRARVEFENNTISLSEYSNPLTNDDYSINAGMIQQINTVRENVSELRQCCNVINTATDATLPFLYVDDTSTAAAVVEKKGGGYTNAGFTFNKVSAKAYPFTTGVMPVSVYMIADAAFDLTSYIARLMGKRLARTECDKYISGNGANATPDEPTGLLTQVPVSRYYYPTDTNWFDVFAYLHGQVASDYAANGCYITSPTLWNSVIRSMDGIGRPLFLDNVHSATGNRIAVGKPVYLDPTLTTQIYFGDFKDYAVIRDVGQTELVILKEFYRPDYNSLGFLANSRSDFLVTDPYAIVGCDIGGSVYHCGEPVTITISE